MRKIFIILILLISLIFFNGSSANASVEASNGQKAPAQTYSSTYSTSYYSSVVGKKSDNLLEGLATISINEHDYYNTYAETKGGLAITDLKVGSSYIRDFYTGIDLSTKWDGNNNWNREHVWCSSKSGGLFSKEVMGESSRGAAGDIHHIRPEIVRINNYGRNDALFAEVRDRSDAENYSYTNYLTGKEELSGCYRISQDYFEPNDFSKGDVARILMYLYMHYSTEVSANSKHTYAGALKITNIVYTSDGTENAAWELLLRWNELDPVDAWEVSRHKKCVEMTGVRNPFIDHPEFAEMIWDKSYSGGGALSDSGSSSEVDYQSLLTEYYNNGVYTKKTNIYLNNTSSNELETYFHGNVDKERTTYYNGSYLLMGNIDGTFASVDADNKPINGINSGYRTAGNDMNHFVYKDGNVVDTYTVLDTNINSYFISLYKMKNTSYLNSTWSGGVHNVTSKNDLYLADFLAFTAPCLESYVLTSNYLTASGMKLTIEELSNSIGNYLSLKMYVASFDSGKVGNDLLLSEARIYKGNALFDDSNLTGEDIPSSGGNNEGSSSGGSTTPSTPSTPTTPTKQTYSYTFTSKIYSAEGTETLGDRNWKVSGTDGAYYGYDGSKGHQFGSEKSPFTTLNITVTTNFTNISSVYITTCGAKGTEATMWMEIGSGNSYGERSLTSTSSTYRFTPGGATGRVSFKFKQSTSAGKALAIYVKEIRVYYTSGATATYSPFDLDNQNDDLSFDMNANLITIEELNKKYF